MADGGRRAGERANIFRLDASPGPRAAHLAQLHTELACQTAGGGHRGHCAVAGCRDLLRRDMRRHVFAGHLPALPGALHLRQVNAQALGQTRSER